LQTVLCKRGLPDPHWAPQTEPIQQVNRIARIVRVLRSFVRQREQVGESQPMAPIVQSVVDLYAEALRVEGVTCAVVLPSEPLVVHGGIDDLQELLLNLVENAREAVTAGGQVRIVLARQGGTLRLLVEDDGGGFGANPEQLFQSFFTTKTTGTGLGLAIARRIAATLGGSLIGENRFVDGRGARFVLSLPLAQPSVEHP
jgi:signal transduction histidine kinase